MGTLAALPFLLALLFPAARGNCSPLDVKVCSQVCVPFLAGTPDQSNFSCGDWWLRARCCNGSVPIPLVTSTFYQCTCESQGMTARGLAVIVVLILAAVAVVVATAFNVLHRQNKKIQVEEEERDKAIEEAQVYLPR